MHVGLVNSITLTQREPKPLCETELAFKFLAGLEDNNWVIVSGGVNLTKWCKPYVGCLGNIIGFMWFFFTNKLNQYTQCSYPCGLQFHLCRQ